MKKLSSTNVFRTILFLTVINFHEFVPKSCGKQYGVIFWNEFGDGTQLQIYFQLASPDRFEKTTSPSSFYPKYVDPDNEVVYLLNIEDGDSIRRVQYKCTIRWKEPNGNIILQTFLAFDNDPNEGLVDVIYHDNGDSFTIAWCLERHHRYLVNAEKQKIFKGSWSTSIGPLYQVRLSNRRGDGKELEIVSMEDPRRTHDLPSLTSINLKAGKEKAIEFNVDDKDIDYLCTVKWNDEDGRQIVERFSAFKYSAKGLYPIQSCGVILEKQKIGLNLKEHGIYIHRQKYPVLVWNSFSSSHPH